jgi:predicted dinucleotide-binding enzyme
VIFLSGDDVEAKSEVVGLFEDAGFFAWRPIFRIPRPG